MRNTSRKILCSGANGRFERLHKPECASTKNKADTRQPFFTAEMTLQKFLLQKTWGNPKKLSHIGVLIFCGFQRKKSLHRFLSPCFRSLRILRNQASPASVGPGTDEKHEIRVA
ncbi:hypothetical protein [Comamonas sp. GB3 AK4-5]|uniref:hypothetical protein n=1 Tax=Comamonas sp. GB3 AK4-5 TaxID=3231487 RepID=UPI00351E280E